MFYHKFLLIFSEKFVKNVPNHIQNQFHIFVFLKTSSSHLLTAWTSSVLWSTRDSVVLLLWLTFATVVVSGCCVVDVDSYNLTFDIGREIRYSIFHWLLIANIFMRQRFYYKDELFYYIICITSHFIFSGFFIMMVDAHMINPVRLKWKFTNPCMAETNL